MPSLPHPLPKTIWANGAPEPIPGLFKALGVTGIICVDDEGNPIPLWLVIKRLIPPGKDLYVHEGTLVLVDPPPAPEQIFDDENK